MGGVGTLKKQPARYQLYVTVRASARASTRATAASLQANLLGMFFWSSPDDRTVSEALAEGEVYVPCYGGPTGPAGTDC